MIIDGRAIARTVLDRLAAQPQRPYFLGAMLVGEDAASIRFLQQKEKTARELGIDFRLYRYPQTSTTAELRYEVGRLAEPKHCGGLIVQLPLPQEVNRRAVLNAIPLQKDVDCLSEKAYAAFASGSGRALPPSVATLGEILRHEGITDEKLAGMKAVLIGEGRLVGRPIAAWLASRARTLEVCNDQTADVASRLANADVVVSGAGAPHLFGAEHLRRGALVIDFGSGSIGEKIVGDFDPAGADANDIRYTPTPGGTGPVLVAKLLENFYTLCRG